VALSPPGGIATRARRLIWWTGIDHRPPQPALSRRHHLCAYGGRLPVSRCRARYVQPSDRRLGNGDASADRAGPSGIGDGDRSAASRAMSSTTATRAPSIHRWRSAAAAGKPAYAHPWDLSVTPTTTPCARASSLRWNASCWHAAGSHRRPRRGWRSSATSRGGTIPPVAIPASAIYPLSPTRRRCSRKLKRPK